MNIYDAARILNKECHRGYEYWSVSGNQVHGSKKRERLDEFEAIAIAEAYERIPDVPSDPMTLLPSSKVIDAIGRCEDRLSREREKERRKDHE